MTSDAQPPTDQSKVRALLDSHLTGGPAVGGASELRSRLTSELVGSLITLPDHVPVWHHVHRSSRELQRVDYDGSALVVHNVEPAGSSFLVHDEAGLPHSRRGPALTLHRPDDTGHDDLLVVFSSDLGD
jgi:hypothetical protein